EISALLSRMEVRAPQSPPAPSSSALPKWVWAAAGAAVIGGVSFVMLRPRPVAEVQTTTTVATAPKTEELPPPIKEKDPALIPPPKTEAPKLKETREQAKQAVTPPKEIKPEPPKEVPKEAPKEAPPVKPVEVVQAPPPKPDPQVVIAQEWEKVRAGMNVAVIEDFQRRHPNSPYASAAQQMIDDIRWDAVNKRDAAALKDYAARYPASRYGREALRAAASIEEIDRLRKAQTETKNQQAQQAEERNRSEQLRTERNAVFAALTRYTTAFDQKNIEALQAAWPDIPKSSVDGLRRAFSDKNLRMTMSLQPLSEPDIRGNTASVPCKMSTITVQGRAADTNTRTVNVFLTKGGGG
ncbi:MAG TPA: hypothetical protein VM120_27270, partial [Bryobacteraceae bacterium]|nr:hypothetical protein [Bryobacteraceae bacterium]